MFRACLRHRLPRRNEQGAGRHAVAVNHANISNGTAFSSLLGSRTHFDNAIMMHMVPVWRGRAADLESCLKIDGADSGVALRQHDLYHKTL